MTEAPLVALAAVEKTYDSGRVTYRALRGIDLEIGPGEMVAIVGPSGSGKTTIVNLIAGIDRPSAGTVTVNGARLDRMSEEALAVWRRANIGLVFQFFQLMPTLSALDNTVLPMELAGMGRGERGRPAPAPCSPPSDWATAATASRSSCPAGNSSGLPWPAADSHRRRADREP
jgi:putative ABC transport system ATP-binding protein